MDIFEDIKKSKKLLKIACQISYVFSCITLGCSINCLVKNDAVFFLAYLIIGISILIINQIWQNERIQVEMYEELMKK